MYPVAQRRIHIAGWSSLVARRAHNPKVVGSNPAPATKTFSSSEALFLWAVSFLTFNLGRILVEIN